MSRSNIGSILISSAENEQFFGLLKNRVLSLAAAVVQLVTSSAGSRSWKLVITGVASFVKDWNRRGFFIQVTKAAPWSFCSEGLGFEFSEVLARANV